MKKHVSQSAAIWTGMLFVNLPVLIFIFAPYVVIDVSIKNGLIDRYFEKFLPLTFVGGIALAWLWWSLTVPHWRVWAYERVEDIAALKAKAVEMGLTWPDGHILARTEIKTRALRERERELDA